MLIFVFPRLSVFWLLVYIVYTSLFNIIALTYQKKKKKKGGYWGISITLGAICISAPLLLSMNKKSVTEISLISMHWRRCILCLLGEL